MIRSFKHAGLEKFYKTGSKAGIQPDHAAKLKTQLTTLAVAKTPGQLAFPGWKLHPLTGKMAGHWAIKVNGNWRLTFKFVDEDVEVVDYQDYH